MHHLQPVAQKRRRLVELWQERQDPGPPFPDLLAHLALQIIDAGSRMGIDHQDGALVVRDDRLVDEPKGRVLEDVGMVAGVKPVAIAEHDGRGIRRSGPAQPMTVRRPAGKEVR
jgi:hypothetical protein